MGYTHEGRSKSSVTGMQTRDTRDTPEKRKSRGGRIEQKQKRRLRPAGLIRSELFPNHASENGSKPPLIGGQYG